MKTEFGKYVRKHRLLKKFTVNMLADKTGISPSYVNQIENMGRIPTDSVIERLSFALKPSSDLVALMSLAGRVDRDTAAYLASDIELLQFLRHAMVFGTKTQELVNRLKGEREVRSKNWPKSGVEGN